MSSKMLPFELWRSIFQLVYDAKTSLSHPPSPYILSRLHSRNLIYLNLASVCKSWKIVAFDVFLEHLQAETLDALNGMLSAKGVCGNKGWAQAVEHLSFSFWNYRCSASVPRRPRLLHPTSDEEVDSRHQRALLSYYPSNTRKASHWTKWHSQVSSVLHLCTSLREVSISFSPDQPDSQYYPPIRRYDKLFPAPDMRNEGILHGLLASSNLRSLILIDPTPLEQYGPAFSSWPRLRSLCIILTRSFPTLSETSFCPPRLLESFAFYDRSDGKIPWPLSSDLAKCTDLQKLELGICRDPHLQTLSAIAFLLSAYQDTLIELNLELIKSRFEPSGSISSASFEQLLGLDSTLHFTKLKKLSMKGAECSLALFTSFKADALEIFETGSLSLPPKPVLLFGGVHSSGTGDNMDGSEIEEVNRWQKGITRSALARLKCLSLAHKLADPHLKAACEALGIDIRD